MWQLLKEMIDARSAVPDQNSGHAANTITQELSNCVPLPLPRGILERLYSTVAELISAPFRMPKLALGTAAAVVVLAIISIPLWQSFQEIPRPDSGLAVQESPAQKPSEVASFGNGSISSGFGKRQVNGKARRDSEPNPAVGPGSHYRRRPP